MGVPTSAYEEILPDMCTCQLSHDILNPCTAYVLCCRHLVEVSGFSTHVVTQGRGMSDAEKGNYQV